MTGAEFNDRYQLVRQVSDGTVRTFHAVASSGAVVMVHIVAPGAPEETRVLVDLLGRLDPNEKQRILDVTEIEGSPVIVTKFILEFTSLKEWLDAHATVAPGAAPGSAFEARTTPSPSAEQPPPRPAPPGQEPPPAPRPAPPAPPRPPERPEPAPEPEPPTPFPAQSTGEFTRMFRAAGAPPPDTPKPPPEPPNAAPAAAAAEPGEFTRTFGRPPVPTETDPALTASPPDSRSPESSLPASFTDAFRVGSPPASGSSMGTPSSSGEGEFTRMMRIASGLGTGSRPAPPPPAATPPSPPPSSGVAPLSPPPPRKKEGPGEFTRWFERQTGPEPASDFSIAPAGGGADFNSPGGADYLARLSGAPPISPSTSLPPSAPPAAPPPVSGGPPPAPSIPWSAPPAPRSGPGEYTRIFSAPPTPPPLAPPPPPPAQPVKGPSKTLVIGGIIAIVLILVLLLVLLVLLSRRPAAEPAPATPPDSAVTAPAAEG